MPTLSQQPRPFALDDGGVPLHCTRSGTRPATVPCHKTENINMLSLQQGASHPGETTRPDTHADERPVDGVQVAEFGVLLDADGSAGDVPQVVQADVLQAGHLEDHQRIVVEEGTPTYDGEVWEERAQAVQAGHSEQQQVVGDHGQLGEAERAEDILMDVVVVLVADEEDLQWHYLLSAVAGRRQDDRPNTRPQNKVKRLLSV
ncbi:hypothetical protein EYF80_025765 [Liparis tanakae]|uniref:Uncharacterized protein n=1 Tax=Liparis tanakae TaxID=230148 RepID=A0A4Z2HGS4_9TELE|nr:hypothetical protein EYF80_025765 [Liparis tanakae]